MTGHTAKGWPYALPTDALIDYPAASLELANKLDGMRDFVFLPTGTDGLSAGITTAAGITELQDSLAVKFRILFTPPVAGMFTYSVQTVFAVNDGVWTRAEIIARILKQSDNSPGNSPPSGTGYEVHASVYGNLTGGVQYPAAQVQNRCPVAAGVPIYGAAFILVYTGTFNYWNGPAYARAFASFTPSQ
jgi:hypothetical protein